jgi:TonB family protein
MAPVTKEPEILSSTQSTGTTPPAGAKAQPAAAEIPVTVNGARSVEGTDRREPFSEKTQTVLVFANGGVIRLSSAVSSGQLLFLTNEKSRKEVVCQVLKSKNYSSVSGYVELEFTEAAPGFWGIRFPGSETPANVPAAAKPPLPTIPTPKIPPPSAKPVEDAIAKTNATKAPAPVSPISISPAVTPTTPQRATQLPQQSPAIAADKHTDTKPSSGAKEQNSSAVPKIPTLSEFLTHGQSGPELKPERVKPVTPPEAKLDAAAKTARDSDKQESLTSLLVPAAPKENPAPGTYTFDFAADEVKIPAWLEPLARNSSTVSVPSETKIPATHDLDAKAPDARVSDTNEIVVAPAESLTSDSDSDEQQQSESHSKEPVTQDSDLQAVFTLAADGPTPNFGSSLALDNKSGEAEASSQGSGAGLKFGLLAAGLVLAVSAGWYWYSNQQQSVAASGTAAVPAISGTTAANTPSFPTPNGSSSNATSSNGTSSQPAKSALSNDAANLDANRRPTNAQTIRTDGKEFATTPNAASKSAATNDRLETLSVPEKKPALGHVRLAAPVVGKRELSSSNGDDNNGADSAPSLGGSANVSGDSGGVNLLATKSNQPSAPIVPITVGGDVKPARLLSSVAPAYPQMARNQRVSGDVKIDALIDAGGRVSATKVISGPALLHQAAQDAVRQWKYQPATLNGQPTPMHLTVTVQFKLQ